VKGVQDNRFILGTDRKLWIQRWFKGDWSVPMESTPVPWMRPPTEFNTVRFEVEQGIARVFVNSRYVNQVRISQYQPGEVALMLFSHVAQPDIRFKRIRMWKLKESSI
jgi:hypothetical protein